jgi:hypothetical protein
VSEELALDERGGQRGAVHRDERAVAPRAVRVKGAGEQFLAGAGLPEEQHGRAGVGDLANLLEGRVESGAPPDDFGEVRGLAELGFEIRALGLQTLA